MRYLKKLHNLFRRNLQVKIALIYLVLVLIPVVVFGIINTRIVTKEMEELLTVNTTEVIKKQLDALDNLFTRTNEIAVQLMLNPEIKSRLSDFDGTMDQEGVSRYNYINNELNKIMIQRSEYSNITIIPSNAKNFTEKDKQPLISVRYAGNPSLVCQTNWFRKAAYTFDVPAFIQQDELNQDGSRAVDKSPDAVMVYAFKNLSTNKKMGTVCITISHNQIKKIVSSFDNSMQYSQIVSDQDGNIIVDNSFDAQVKEYLKRRSVIEQGLSTKNLVSKSVEIEGRNYLIVGGQSEVSRFSIQYAIPGELIFQNIYRIKNIIVGICLLCFLSSLLVIFIIFKKILIPIKELQKKMVQVENGNLNVWAKVKGDNEVERLAGNFNHMVQSIVKQNKQIMDGEKKKREYEIMALQAQINPHFLYNTLDSIKWIAMTQGNHTIEKMSKSLIFLLRKTISNKEEFVTLGAELMVVSHYVEIQKLRYYNTFDYEVDLPEDLKDVRIPKLLLQPLVENALFHGIYNCGRRGLVRVTVLREDGIVFAEVWDNGKGMDKETVKNAYRKPKDESFSGIGVHNVDERIKLYYGEGYGLEFVSEIGKYTRAIIKMPYRVAEKEEESACLEY